MFEETEWEGNGADDTLTRTLFQEYPKIKQKKKKSTLKKKGQEEGRFEDELAVSEKLNDKMKDSLLTKMSKLSPEKKKGKENHLKKVKVKVCEKPNMSKSKAKQRQEKVETKGHNEPDALKIKSGKSSRPITATKTLKKSMKSKLKTSATVATVEKTKSGKNKNKYKSLIGEVKDVGHDIKVVKPVLDIPRKMKLAGINTTSISKAEVKAAIEEMSSPKPKVKPKRKRKQQVKDSDKEIPEGKEDASISETPPKKKKKLKKARETNENEAAQEETGQGQGKRESIKSDLDSYIVKTKTKNKRKKLQEDAKNMEENLPAKKKNKLSEEKKSKKKMLDKGSRASKMSSSSEADVIHSAGKSKLSVNKLKSLLSQDKEDTLELEESVGDFKDKNTEMNNKKGKDKRKKKKEENNKSLKETLEDRLTSSRFRYLNERLYTCTGEEAMQMFREDADAFHCYHKGFQTQVEKWPSNPVDRVIEYLKARPARLVVADFGCGEAKVAQNVRNQVHSFDLVKVNEYVTVCDISQVPLEEESVDVAVFCLSLMGTNFTDFICEASRVLKTGGVLLVAEVTSRFVRPTRFARKVEKLGFALEKQDQSNKMFIWFEFKKTGDIPPEDRIPKLELAPCYYKRR